MLRNNNTFSFFISAYIAHPVNLTWATDEETGLEYLERIGEERETIYRDYAVLVCCSVSSPVGRFLLVQKNSATCALRVTSFRRERDARPETAFNTGSEHRSAEIEWHFLEHGSGNFTGRNASHGRGKVATGPLVGFMRFMFQTTSSVIDCGTLELDWNYPDRISFFQGSHVHDYGIEMAPTVWENLSDVRADDDSLTWYRFDDYREAIAIPIEDLQKGK